MRKATIICTWITIILFIVYWAFENKAVIGAIFFPVSLVSIGLQSYFEINKWRILRAVIEPRLLKVGDECVIQCTGFTPHVTFPPETVSF
jgi:hypothetical protein